MRFIQEAISCVLLTFCLLFSLAAGTKLHFPFYAIGDQNSLFGNLTSPFLNFLDDFFTYLEDSKENVSQQCKNETRQLIELARNGNTEALKIFDSCGKPSSGILEGSVYFIGYYSECVHTVAGTLRGKYCLVNLNVSSASHQEVLPHASWQVLSHNTKPPTLGICIPKGCTEQDAQYAAQASVLDNFDDVGARVSICHVDETGMMQDAGAVVTLLVFLLFVAVGTVATVFDFIIERRRAADRTSECNKTISTTELFQKEAKPNDPSLGLRCLLAFSFKSNGRKIFTVTGGGDNIGVVHGLKFLSMALIILGHTFSFATQYLYIRNLGDANQAPKDFVSQIFANGTLAVDTFYFISGLLVSFVTLKTMDKLNGKLPLLFFYLHRYFRLTPVLGAVVLFCAFLLRHLGSGPNWSGAIQMYDGWCRQNGWLNVLYLHNFVNTENMCLSHSWYLATDMQMYLVTPLILIPLHRSLKYGILSMSTFLLATIITTAALTAINHYPAIPYINNIVPMDVVNAYYKNVYIKPYCRIGPYIVGMAIGYYLLNTKDLVLKKWVVFLLWCSSVAGGLCVIYLMWPANQGHLPSNGEAAAYSALARTAWATCLAWLVVACYYGYGGAVSWVLSWPALVPLSRLTYCAYLIHPVVMNAYYGTVEAEVVFSMPTILYLFLGNLCITYFLSTLLSLLFESPFVSLERVLLSAKKES